MTDSLPTAPAHVLLRPATLADRDDWFPMMSDPVSLHMAAFTSPNPDDRAAFDARWQRILANDAVPVRTIEVDGRVAGSVLRYVDEGRSEVSYWVDRSLWGRGIATAALRLFLDEFPERPLYARAAADNHGSLRVLERCGFVRVALERGFAPARGMEIEEVVLVHGE